MNGFIVFCMVRRFYIESTANQLIFSSQKTPWICQSYLDARDLCNLVDADLIIEFKEFGVDKKTVEAYCINNTVPDSKLDSILNKVFTFKKLHQIIMGE